MIVVAVDVHTGELAAFDRDSGVDLVDAVTTSTALPGMAPTHNINGTHYINGGMRSGETPTLPRATRPMLWTSGDPNRRLHVPFAQEETSYDVFCSKDAAAQLRLAVRAALDGRRWVDPLLSMHSSPGFAQPMRETILASSARLAVWQAMALGYHQHKAIARFLGVSPNSVRNGMKDMCGQLRQFDPGHAEYGSPLEHVDLLRGKNDVFFLDDTVNRRFR